MRVKRQKTNKRHMAVYQTSFAFRTPYQVLGTFLGRGFDAGFVQAGLEFKIHIKEQLPKVMMGSTKQMVTECTMSELRNLGDDYTGAVLAAKRFERRRCKHAQAVPSAQCITEIIADDNPHNYCVATQDKRLRDHLRVVRGVPLLYINRAILILEPPSAVTMEMAKEIERQKTLPTKKEITFLTKSNSDTAKRMAAKKEAKLKKKKHKGPKEPNSLSVKRKKTVATTGGKKEGHGKENEGEKSGAGHAQKRKRGDDGDGDDGGDGDDDVKVAKAEAKAGARDCEEVGVKAEPVATAKKPRKRKKKSRAGKGVDGARAEEGDGSESD
ncbi:Fcf1-domain-containing protein [Jimgerdemannia flammicorona]|uniref:U three protein 23 n=1 Tax=Jimgerdemannia flammicorona TaxID=994334 RepID=A0A433QPV5_9FUNG|nr:Fcf1-domain-containing protein [Jimgerdemannia flammicorona]